MSSFIAKYLPTFLPKLSILLLSALVVAACGGGSDDNIAGPSDVLDLETVLVEAATESTAGLEVSATVTNNGAPDTKTRKVEVTLLNTDAGVIGSLSATKIQTEKELTMVDGFLNFPIYPGSDGGTGRFRITVYDDEESVYISPPQNYTMTEVIIVDPDPEFSISVSIKTASSGGIDHGEHDSPITVAAPGFVIANVKNGGTNLKNEIVEFSLSSANGVLLAESALTNAEGNAVVQLNPGTSTGTGTVTVSVVLDGGTYTDTINFASSVSPATTDVISLGVDWSDTLNFCNSRPTSLAITTNTATATKGTYNNIVVTDLGLVGTGMTVNVTVAGGAVSTVQIANAGTGYVDTNEVTIPAGALGAASSAVKLRLAYNTVYTRLAIYVEDKENPNCQVSGPDLFNPIQGSFPLKTGVTSKIKVNVYNETKATKYTVPLPVTFSSLCAELGKATLGSATSTTSTVTSVAGIATTTYLSNGCVGEDTISAVATVGSSNLTAQVTFDIEVPKVSSIEFVSATPKVLALKGTGGANRVETSVVKFRVVGSDGLPSADRDVYLALSSQPGGVSLDTNKATSNTDGMVEVTVSSGTVSGTLIVRATFDVNGDGIVAPNNDDDIVVHSGELSIASGLADQDGINLSAERLNPEAWNYPNESVQITASLNDRSGENVAIGTAVYFRTELGRIGDGDGDAVCYTDISGSCSVTWFSNGPEETAYVHYDPTPFGGLGVPGGTSPGFDRKGRNVIYAFTQGEETFIDANGNNVFDIGVGGDAFIDQGEFYLDLNENGSRELGVGPPFAYLEPYIEYDGDSDFDAGDGFFNGVTCSAGALAAGHCADLVNIYDSITMAVSTSSARIFMSNDSADLDYTNYTDGVNGFPNFATPPNSYTYSGESGGTLYVLITDQNGNAMPEGTTVKAEATDQYKILGPVSFSIGSSSFDTFKSFGVQFDQNEDKNKRKPGFVTVTVTTPKGNPTSRSFSFTPGKSTTCDVFHSIHFSDAGRTVTEGNSGTFEVRVNIKIETPKIDPNCATNMTQNIVLDYFVTDNSNNDHEITMIGGVNVDGLSSGTITLTPANDWSTEVVFTITGDTDIEPEETLRMFLGDPSNAAILGTNKIFEIKVPNDD